MENPWSAVVLSAAGFGHGGLHEVHTLPWRHVSGHLSAAINPSAEQIQTFSEPTTYPAWRVVRPELP